MKVYHASSLIVGHPDTAHSNYQLCFRTQQAIDRCLTFIESRKL